MVNPDLVNQLAEFNRDAYEPEGMEPPDARGFLLSSALSNTALPSIFQQQANLGDLDLFPEEEVDQSVRLASHRENLANFLPENTLSEIGSNLHEDIEADYRTGALWRTLFKRGMILMGLTEESVKGDFLTATAATHPMIAEACIRFWARTMPELLPMQGPAKGKVIGEETEQAVDLADGMAKYINYQISNEDRGYREHTNKLVFQMPFQGASFRKTRYDEEQDTVCAVFVPSDELIAAYGITSFETAPRFTHRYRMSKLSVDRKMQNGLFRQTYLGEPHNYDDEALEVQSLKDESAGIEADDDSYSEYIINECYVFMDVPGLEDDVGPLPYIVLMEYHTNKVLAIYRDWRVDDPMKSRIRRWTKYEYLPGFGFYGLGLIPLVGALSEQSTSLMRIITNGGAFSSIPGGFATKDSRMDDGDVVIEPGKFKKVDASFEELSKAFFAPTFKEPAPVLLTMLEHGEKLAQRITGTTDLEVGSANNNAPVGTTMALLEKAMEIPNAIQLNIHSSLAQELEIRYEFTRDYLMPELGGQREYGHGQGGARPYIIPEMFDMNITRIIPTTDPSQSSSTKRIASAQMVYQLAQENPDVLDKKIAIERVLRAGEVPDPESLFISAKEPQPLDPVSEGYMFLVGEPVKAFADQDHAAHIAVHQAFAQNPQFGGNKQFQEIQGPALLAHIAEHAAFLYVQQAMQLGINVVPPEAGEEGMQSPIPPEMQNQIAIQAASMAREMAQFQGIPQEEADGEAEHEQKLRHKDEEHEQKLRHRDEDSTAKLIQQMEKNDIDNLARRSNVVSDLSDRSVKRDLDRADRIREASEAAQIGRIRGASRGLPE